MTVIDDITNMGKFYIVLAGGQEYSAFPTIGCDDSPNPAYKMLAEKKIVRGDDVNLKFLTNKAKTGKEYKNLNDIALVKAREARGPSEKIVDPGIQKPKVEDDVWERKDRRITRLSTQKTAAEFIVAVARLTFELTGQAEIPTIEEVIQKAKLLEKDAYREEK